jgi:hypothetical protein
MKFKQFHIPSKNSLVLKKYIFYLNQMLHGQSRWLSVFTNIYKVKLVELSYPVQSIPKRIGKLCSFPFFVP